MSEPTPVAVQAFDFGTTAPYWSTIAAAGPASSSVVGIKPPAASCVATGTSCILTYSPAGAGWAGLVLLSPDGGDLTVTAGRASPSPAPQR